jgi:IMP dehydrogenase
MAAENVLDYNTALEVLKSEEKDGLDVYSLLDSKVRGGLTYNDFLVLPGYIGTPSS